MFGFFFSDFAIKCDKLGLSFNAINCDSIFYRLKALIIIVIIMIISSLIT